MRQNAVRPLPLSCARDGHAFNPPMWAYLVNDLKGKNRAASVFRRASAHSFEAWRFLFRLLFSWSLDAFFILTGQHAIPLVECLAECRLRGVARPGDDRFEWQVSCVHEVCGSLHTPSLDILHRLFSPYRLYALAKSGTR